MDRLRSQFAQITHSDIQVLPDLTGFAEPFTPDTNLYQSAPECTLACRLLVSWLLDIGGMSYRLFRKPHKEGQIR